MSNAAISPSNAPVFVVGPPRCGTTLTAALLGESNELFMPGETHYLHDVYSRRRELGDLADRASRERAIDCLRTLYGRYNEPADQARVDELFAGGDFAEQLHAAPDYGALLDLFMRLQAETLGKSRWGNNAPKDVFHFEEISRFYPDARFVCCIRDPRDFLLSYKNQIKVTRPDRRERVRRLYHPLITSLLWKASVSKVLELMRKVDADRRVLCPYERLVNHPEGTVKSICRVAGVRWDPSLLDVNFSNSSSGAASGGIYSSSIGRWREELSPAEVWIVQLITGPLMDAFGYERERVQASWKSRVSVVLSAPAGLMRALSANRHLRGPLLPYVARRVAGLLH